MNIPLPCNFSSRLQLKLPPTTRRSLYSSRSLCISIPNSILQLLYNFVQFPDIYPPRILSLHPAMNAGPNSQLQLEHFH
jgi:hypothetical protein